ncbi:peptidase domain-containing ABC transporter [Rhizobium rhizogenes]|uniref:peptidase domain-containing ABC transporter n=1 Tax=Rhizobium rhizogenes TaxID=359 RepID=UPI001574CFB7|nr:peptidase domain-containing ABC transporter [Rhizobium rhizogenes]NTH23025.1 peptidase domain-containing ABC transporter [Rhizobium rhizogenes]NTH36055.1 peptidase domain-containing ABC transporter [Rhizobium rhizogenes]
MSRAEDIGLPDRQIGVRGRRLPVIRQAESAECGLACLAMIANFWGFKVDLLTLRTRFNVSTRGWNLQTLIKNAEHLDLTSRALRIELQALRGLKLPAILHWEFKHFVVLSKVARNYVIIHDPRFGKRKVGMAEFSRCFTGAAVEFWPSRQFMPQDREEKHSWRDIVGRPKGLRGLFLRLFFFGFSLEVVGTLIPLVAQWGIDNVALASDIDLLVLICLVSSILLGIQMILTAVRSWIVSVATTEFILQWKIDVFSHMVRLPLDFFNKRRVGDITSRYDSIERIIGIVNDNFVEGILDGMFSISTLLIMFFYSEMLSFVAITGASIYVFVRIIRSRSIKELTQTNMSADAKENSNLIETIRGIKVIKLYSNFKIKEQTWISSAFDEAESNLNLEKTKILFRLLSNFISGVEYIVIFFWSLQLVMNHTMTIGMVIAFYAYRSKFYTSVSSLTDNILDLQIVRVHTERVADLVLTQAEPLIVSKEVERIGDIGAKLCLTNVCFRYDSQERNIVDNVTLSFDEGESVAIVGASGCGKTTLLNLLCGFIEPTSGNISVGGIPVLSLGLKHLRDLISAVMQDDVLFAGTIASNISAFDSQLSIDRIMDCGRIAHIHNEIIEMPMGYGTLVGDSGVTLSGGQRQRVCIARALYKNPRILILDEATSHLDLQKEREVNAAIRKLGVTRIVVAHRLETIQAAERIVLLDQGRIVADTRDGAAREGILKRLRD